MWEYTKYVTFQKNRTNQIVKKEKALETFFPLEKWKDLRNLGKHEDNSGRLKQSYEM